MTAPRRPAAVIAADTVAASPSDPAAARRAALEGGGTMLERPMRPAVDVSALPTIVFGSRDLVWWGTWGFMIVESMSLAVCVASYFYLKRNFGNWPPLRTPLPRLGIPTASLAVLLLALVPTRLFHRAARRRDAGATTLWLWVATLVTGVATALRVLEFNAIGARWDLNAYTSAVWAIVFAHFTLVLVDTFETGTLAAYFSAGAYQEKHFVDATNNALYTYFMILVWVPLYALVYLLPRWV